VFLGVTYAGGGANTGAGGGGTNGFGGSGTELAGSGGVGGTGVVVIAYPQLQS
jgi:hypothetical protein